MSQKRKLSKIQEQAKKSYQLLFDEINALTKGETALFTTFNEPKEKARERFESCLFWFYVDGFSSGILQMGGDGIEMPNGYEFLDITYSDGESVLEKFDKYYDGKDAESISRLLESESHRMYNQGSIEAIKGISEAHRGTSEESATDVDRENNTGSQKGWTKTWMTMGDDRVRDTHWYLEGETIPIDEEFVTYTGDTALAPGMFGVAEQDAGCRCFLLFDEA